MDTDSIVVMSLPIFEKIIKVARNLQDYIFYFIFIYFHLNTWKYSFFKKDLDFQCLGYLNHN